MSFLTSLIRLTRSPRLTPVAGVTTTPSRISSSPLDSALRYADQWLGVIHQKDFPETEEAKWIIAETVKNFSEHVNPGLLENRKSVTLSGDFAATEWNGDGAVFEDVMGRQFIDFLGGYGLMSHGWSHPDVVSAVQAQLLCNPMPSQELLDPLRGALANLIAQVTPGGLQYSFFVASGTEANEGAIKLAKMHTKKDGFIVSVKGFHGKTMGSLSMMGKSDYKKGVGTLYGGPVYFIPFGDADAVEQQIEICEKTGIGIAAVMMEPIQGEAGAIVPDDDFWPRIRRVTKDHNILLIADEVQTGLGRTGKMWGVDHWGVTPDIMTMGKALGGGVMPVAAFVSTAEIWKSMFGENPFMHTNTSGGGALACAAAIAAIQVALRDDLSHMAEQKGSYMMERMQRIAKTYPDIYESVTGRGLLIGQHFRSAEIGYRVIAEAFSRNVLIAGTLNSAITARIEPPLVISYDEIDEGLSRLEEAVRVVSEELGGRE